jgi:DNA polymerase III delta prime subunit
MHAFLLINSNPGEFATKQKAKQIPFTLQKIDDVRELKKFVKFSFFEKTAIIIEDIDKATAETQNAFLKNLEEPSNNLIYILTASNINNVLPTITSRCQVIKIQDTGYRIYDKNSNFKDALNIKDRTEAIKFIENLIYIDHEKNIFQNQENYLQSLKNLKANGNVSLQLLNLVVRMEGHGK